LTLFVIELICGDCGYVFEVEMFMLRFITHVFLEDYYMLMRVIYDDCLSLRIFMKIRLCMFLKNIDVTS